MNDARNRRPQIRERARKALIKRLMTEPPPPPMPPSILPVKELVVRARVYLKGDFWPEDGIVTSVICELPLEHITRKIDEMNTQGFWFPRPNDGVMRYIPPHSISQVIVNAGETYNDIARV